MQTSYLYVSERKDRCPEEKARKTMHCRRSNFMLLYVLEDTANLLIISRLFSQLCSRYNARCNFWGRKLGHMLTKCHMFHSFIHFIYIILIPVNRYILSKIITVRSISSLRIIIYYVILYYIFL